MELSFNTSTVDIKVALKALKLYRAALYPEAISGLLEVLDKEPNNWDARIMLGACYYKTAGYAAAHRAFRFVYDRAKDAELRQKAIEGMRAAQMKLEKRADIPLEFGVNAPKAVARTVAWLD